MPTTNCCGRPWARGKPSFFNDLRTLTRYFVFDSWEHLLTFMIQQLELEPPPNTS